MNSFSHYAYGSVGQWIFENIGGIKSVEPGYKKIVIKPYMTDQLEWANVSYDSVRGKVSVKWTREGEKVKLDVEIPPDTMALVYVPGKENAVAVGGGKHSFKGEFKQ